MNPMKPSKQRVLVLSRDNQIHQDLTRILSIDDYVIDHTFSRLEGIRTFITVRQPIVIIDLHLLPRVKRKLHTLYKIVKKTPVIIALTKFTDDPLITRSKQHEIDDILPYPLRSDIVLSTIQRAFWYSNFKSELLFLKDIFFLIKLSLPLWIGTIIFLIIHNQNTF